MTDTDIAVREDEGAEGSLLNFVALAVRDSSVDVAKLEALLRMQREIKADWASVEYNKAMNAAQAEVQPVARTAENTQTHSFYAKLEHVDAALRPIYLRHGFSLSYNTVAPLVAGNIRVECRCAHIAGHSELFYREAPADTLGPKGTAVKTILHGGGSTETYLKRYLSCGIFNIVFQNQDDDGVRGGQRFIDGESVRTLDGLIRETKSDFRRFCELFGVHGLPEIEVKDYPGAVNALLDKKRKMGGAS